MSKIRSMARWQIIALVVILVVFLAGCTNVRRGVSWPALELVTINDQPLVVVAYDGQIEIIDPYNGGDIYIARDADGDVILNADNDAKEWIIRGNDLDGAQFFVSPYRDGDTLLFPTYNSRMLEFDVFSGEIESVTGIELTDGVLADIVVTDDLIYVPYRQQDVVALDRETYEEVWRFDTAEGVWAAPLLVDNTLYVTSINHNLFAVNAQTGQPIWSQPVDLEGAIASTPLFDNGYLYVGSYAHKMYQIDIDGVIVNEYEGNNWIWGTPVIDDGVLYYTDLNGYVYALNADNLSEIWVQRPSRKGIRPAPIVTEQFVVVAGRDGSVYWLDRSSGATVQEEEIDGSPELLSDILYLPADEENGRPELMLIASTQNNRLVSAFNMDTFSPQWVYGR